MKLAIKGHATRGDEVIKILEMLGGKNRHFSGTDNNLVYYIRTDGYTDTLYAVSIEAYKVFTLEAFIEEFPYQVGDKVIAYAEACLAQFTIKDMRWNTELNKVEYKICSSWLDTSMIQSYKEKESIPPYMDYDVKTSDKETMEEKLEQIILDIPNGYEFFGINDDNKVVLTKKQQRYPKTYYECCDTLQLEHTFELNNLTIDEEELTDSFIRLMRCRDAYWKIAGEQMGLGKPWKPNYLNPTREIRYFIFCKGNTIEKGQSLFPSNKVLIFSSEEIRDAFYENFKELIEECNELL